MSLEFKSTCRYLPSVPRVMLLAPENVIKVIHENLDFWLLENTSPPGLGTGFLRTKSYSYMVSLVWKFSSLVKKKYNYYVCTSSYKPRWAWKNSIANNILWSCEGKKTKKKKKKTEKQTQNRRTWKLCLPCLMMVHLLTNHRARTF